MLETWNTGKSFHWIWLPSFFLLFSPFTLSLFMEFVDKSLLYIFSNLEVATSAVIVTKLVVPTRNTRFLPKLTLD